MTTNEVATAYVTLLPSFKGASKAIAKELGDTSATQGAGKSAGKGWVSGLTKWAKRGTVLGIGATVGTAITAGFSRAIQIQDATKKLEGLGYSSKAVAKISNDALGSVKGTAFGMGEAMTTASSAVAAGVKPGEDLQRTLGLVADAATIGGTSMGEMGGIFNQVAASGKMQADVANQLLDRGIPIWQFLGDTMGKSQEEVQKLASAGKIDFATFQKAMEHGLGGAAKASGETFTGSLKNVVAALGRLGAMFATPLVNAGPKLFQSLASAIDSLTPVLEPVAEKFANWLGPAMENLAKWVGKVDFGALFAGLKSGLGPLAQMATSLSPIGVVLRGMAPVLPQIGDALAAVGKAVGGVLLTALPLLAEAFGKIGAALSGAIAKLLPALVPLFLTLAGAIGALAPVLEVVVPLIAQLVTWLVQLVTPLLSSKVAVLALVGAFVAWKAVIGGIKLGTLVADLIKMTGALAKNTVAWLRNTAAAIASKAQTVALAALYAGGFIANIVRSTAAWVKNTAIMVANKTATVAITVATKAWSLATKAAAIAQRVFNAAMRANPIGLIITAIAALVAALVWFFTKTKTGKAIVTAAWSGIKVAIKGVTDWWTKSAWPAMKRVITLLGNAFRAAGKGIAAAWNAMKNALNNTWKWIQKRIINPFKLAILVLRATFFIVKNGVIAAWNAIKNGLARGWAWIKTKVLGAFKTGLTNLRNNFTRVKNGILTVWRALRDGLRAVWVWISKNVLSRFASGLRALRDVFSSVKTRIVSIWRGMRDSLSSVWSWISKRVFGPMKAGVNAIKTAFKRAKDGIASIWNGLKSIAAKPVNFMINTVYNNGLRKMVNTVLGWLHQKKLPKAAPISYDTGGYTGHGSKYDPAGIVHADEFVVRKESRRRFERRNPGALDYLNRTGQLPGYADGGSVSRLMQGLRWWQARGARVGEFKPWTGVSPVHMKGSMHYLGRAGDLNYGPGGQNATETKFFDQNLPEFKRLFPDLHTLWRVKGHFNHLHLDNSRADGGGGGGGFPNPLSIISKIKGLTKKFTGALFDNPFGKVLASVGKRVISAPIEWIKKKLTFGEGDGDPGPAQNFGVKNAVRAVANKYGWGLGQEWGALDWLINTESSWNPNAKNPTSSARGLFQKMTSVHGPLESTVAGQAKWGLDYIKGRYGDPLAAMLFHKSHGFYDNGGWLPNGGIGINTSGKPEAVLTPAQSGGLTHLGEPVDLSRDSVAQLAQAILDGATAVSSRTTARAANARAGALRAGIRR